MTCECKCGNMTTVSLSNLRSGHATSCGCVQRQAGKSNRTHGLSGTKTYRAWQDMIQRCTNKMRPRYATYGARGITVCQRWRDSFEAFLADMGEAPSRVHSIDREDNNGDYEPSNCRWSKTKEQARNTTRNRLLTFRGETKCIAEWSELLCISYATLYYRITHGWTVSEALTIPPGGMRNE